MNKTKQIIGIIITVAISSGLFYYAHYYSHTVLDYGKNFANDWNWGAGTGLLFGFFWVPIIMGIVGIVTVIIEKPEKPDESIEKSASELLASRSSESGGMK